MKKRTLSLFLCFLLLVAFLPSAAYAKDEIYEAAVDSFLTAALGKSHGEGMTDLQKALALHDHLVLNCRYDMNKASSSHSAYSALVERIAVCEGYTRAYNDLLSRVGIDATEVQGYGSDVSGRIEGNRHAWSKVKIGGKYYHVDVTWDDGVPDMKGSLSHCYFMVSDSALSFHRDYTEHCTDTTLRQGLSL